LVFRNCVEHALRSEFGYSVARLALVDEDGVGATFEVRRDLLGLEAFVVVTGVVVPCCSSVYRIETSSVSRHAFARLVGRAGHWNSTDRPERWRARGMA
jgi:hypothetical protein